MKNNTGIKHLSREIEGNVLEDGLKYLNNDNYYIILK